jgi:hypothetical protein
MNGITGRRVCMMSSLLVLPAAMMLGRFAMMPCSVPIMF